MSDMMRYKDYLARVEVDVDAGILHGEVLNLRDVITFQAKSVDELQQEFTNSIEDYLAYCEERGEKADRPFSGNMMLRMPPELHRAVATSAARANVSINRWIVDVVEERTKRELSPPPALNPLASSQS